MKRRTDFFLLGDLRRGGLEESGKATYNEGRNVLPVLVGEHKDLAELQTPVLLSVIQQKLSEFTQ